MVTPTERMRADDSDGWQQSEGEMLRSRGKTPAATSPRTVVGAGAVAEKLGRCRATTSIRSPNSEHAVRSAATSCGFHEQRTSKAPGNACEAWGLNLKRCERGTLCRDRFVDCTSSVHM
ncbi:unnamed protein product [Heligmosomoides polygyrus]|uniref:Uncharacterized protein n=1 Tax=Heligmosomoides polygyrus TaxID=6339 RepID=A0A183FDV1_HELPZ|nr:unnamed protein product [Heligmosomoides polygyrus]